MSLGLRASSRPRRAAAIKGATVRSRLAQIARLCDDSKVPLVGLVALIGPLLFAPPQLRGDVICPSAAEVGLRQSTWGVDCVKQNTDGTDRFGATQTV